MNDSWFKTKTADGYTISVKDPRDLPLTGMLEGNYVDSRNSMKVLLDSLFSEKDRAVAEDLSVPDLCNVLNKAFEFYSVDSNVVYLFIPEDRTVYLDNRFLKRIPIMSLAVPVLHVLISKEVEL